MYKEKNIVKSTVDEIRERFDKDVERFSNAETGQQTTIDASLSLELITEAAKYTNPNAKNLLDIGSGAGNYTLKMLGKIPGLNCTLIDLSRPMLNRAAERLQQSNSGSIKTIQGDISGIDLPEQSFDIVLAGAVLHHLRSEDEWHQVFDSIYTALKPGGSFWIADLISHDNEPVNNLFTHRYGNYLKSLGGEEFQQKVFDYIEKEDTPRSLNFQLKLLETVGFSYAEILHKNTCFAAFGAIK